MASGVLLPNGKQAFADSNGHPLVGGKVFFYVPATNTLKDTWQDQGQTVLNTNPVILDARGEASIYGTGAYRQVLQTSTGVLIWDQVLPDVYAALTTWSALSNYTQATTQFGSDGNWYLWLQASGPGTGAGAKDPTNVANSAYWKKLVFTPGALLRRTIYINVAGVLQSSVDGSAFAPASSTWTPLALTTRWVVDVHAAGGAGGGVQATGAGQYSAGPGGAAGGRAVKTFTGTPAPTAVVVGQGGIPVVGAAGGTGGASSFGTVSATGGAGGILGLAGSVFAIFFGGAAPGGLGSGGDINIRGDSGKPSFYASNQACSGAGGNSSYGGGGAAVFSNTLGTSATSPGAGGAGSAIPPSTGAASAGAGATGMVVVDEYL